MFSTRITRDGYLEEVRTGLGRGPVVALIGPRQCGKTTLSRQLMAAGEAGYFDLEETRMPRIGFEIRECFSDGF